MKTIFEKLAGKKIAVTGATGFLGTAIIERLLFDIDDCEIFVLVRKTPRLSAEERVRREILRNDAFDRLKAKLGSNFKQEVQRRLHAIEGDVSKDGLGLDEHSQSLLAQCSVVIHSAATVSFDSPLDSAIEVNLLGPSRIALAMAEAAKKTGRKPGHLVSVSTAYVAGTRKGDAFEIHLGESPFYVDLSWKQEVKAARRLRGDLEAQSRQPEKLTQFSKEATTELGAAGIAILAQKTERLRNDWIKSQMVEAGKSRARSLGWPDAYAYTKALGEKALLEQKGDVPTSLVRPSIIESALQYPHPGWIRGFRMAEPVIISYGRGLLNNFPGAPEGVIDVIPVDLVVAAIIAVAAHPPLDEKIEVYQVASGTRNPLYYKKLVDLIRQWFTDNPLYDTNGQPIVVPEWSFPGRGKVQRKLTQVTKTFSKAEKIVSTLPIRGNKANIGSRFEQSRADASRALSYVELYGAYAETEARFSINHLLELYDKLCEKDKETFPCDPKIIDWTHYVQNIHLPSIVDHARVRTTPGRQVSAKRFDRGLAAVLSPQRQLAVFDLENTLIASNVVQSYSWLATKHKNVEDKTRFVLETLAQTPSMMALDRKDRGDFLRQFYRRYKGVSVEQIQRDAWDLFADLILPRSFPAGIRRVRQHRALGHKTMLITGALDFIVEPLKPLFDDIVCSKMTQENGHYTGELIDTPPTGEARAAVISEYAKQQGIDLEESVAYADSTSDLPMLEVVGHPVAVNAEIRLATLARKRGWHTEIWDKSKGSPIKNLTLGGRL